MNTKYIRNTDDATIICRIPSDKHKVFVFGAKKIDKRNNIILHNGFTEISVEDIKLLREEGKTFQFYEKTGKLTIADSLPPESMTSEQLIVMLKSENAALKKALAKTAPAENSGELKAALEKIEALEKTIAEGSAEGSAEELKAALERIAEQEKVIVSLEDQIAELVSETIEVEKD